MRTLSLCMIVKNEAEVLARCLDSVKEAVDEIIIVDTGSVDSTKKIAGKYTDRVYDYRWHDDFAAARNFSFSKASMDYQFWLDADDIMPEESVSGLIKLKAKLDAAVDIVTMKYITSMDNEGKPGLISTRERLLRRSKGCLWQDPVHECIPLIGNVLHTELCVIHKRRHREKDPDRNLKIYENLLRRGAELSPRQLFYFARELKDRGQYERAARCFESFLEGGQGWLEDNISACLDLAICHRLLGNREGDLKYLLKSFEYDSPRAELCVELGYHYKEQGDYPKALVWFEIAVGLEPPNHLGFMLPDYRDFVPRLELCVCHYRLGDREKAAFHNDIALSIRPDSEIALSNKAFFEAEGK